MIWRTYIKLPKLYRLASSPLTQLDLERPKMRFGLVRSAISAPAQCLLLCSAFSYNTLLCGTGMHHEKVDAHSKKKKQFTVHRTVLRQTSAKLRMFVVA